MANPLEAFEKLPTWGKFAVAGGSLFVVYIVIRARSGAAAAPAATDTGNIDPQTGYTTGSAQDVAALDALQSGSGFPVTAGSGGVGTVVGTTSGYGTNAAWAQAAENGLAEVGFDPVTVSTALGAYLGGQTLTADQAAIVFAATAEFGAPPVSPPPVTLSSSTGPAVSGNDTGTVTGTTGGTTGGTTTAGGTTAPKSQTSTVSAGRVVSANNNDVKVAWNHAGPATSWRVTLNFPGSENGRQNVVTGPSASYSGLPAGHSGYVLVQPLPTGTPGKIDIKTTNVK